MRRSRGCQPEVSDPGLLDPSPGLPECPHNMVPDFPQTRGSKSNRGQPQCLYAVVSAPEEGGDPLTGSTGAPACMGVRSVDRTGKGLG